jgi:hypothetical protein
MEQKNTTCWILSVKSNKSYNKLLTIRPVLIGINQVAGAAR